MKLSINSLPVRLSVYISSILLIIFLLGMSLLGYFGFRGFSKPLIRHGITTAEETAYRLDRVFVQAELAAGIMANTLEQYSPQKENFAHLVEVEANSIHRLCPELVALTVAFNENMLVSGETVDSVTLEPIEGLHLTKTCWYRARSIIRFPAFMKKGSFIIFNPERQVLITSIWNGFLFPPPWKQGAND